VKARRNESAREQGERERGREGERERGREGERERGREGVNLFSVLLVVNFYFEVCFARFPRRWVEHLVDLHPTYHLAHAHAHAHAGACAASTGIVAITGHAPRLVGQAQSDGRGESANPKGRGLPPGRGQAQCCAGTVAGAVTVLSGA
jgi:hypothetical protein